MPVLWMIWTIAAISIAACLYLWFREVRRIMSERKSMVESAGSQLAVCRRKFLESDYDMELEKISARSESIYRQAVEHYDQAFHKPWIRLPAILMGFRSIPPEDYYMLGRNWKV